MTARIVGIAGSMHELLAITRARMNEIGITYETLNELACLPDGYAQKVMSDAPYKHPKHLGAMSWDALLGKNGALAVKVMLVHDADALRRLRAHLSWKDRKLPAKPVDIAPVLAIASIPWLFTKSNASEMTRRANAKRSAHKRRRIARKAARARWGRQ